MLRDARLPDFLFALFACFYFFKLSSCLYNNDKTSRLKNISLLKTNKTSAPTSCCQRKEKK